MLNFSGEVLLQELIEIGLDFLSCTGFDPLKVKLPPFFAIENAAFH